MSNRSPLMSMNSYPHQSELIEPSDLQLVGTQARHSVYVRRKLCTPRLSSQSSHVQNRPTTLWAAVPTSCASTAPTGANSRCMATPISVMAFHGLYRVEFETGNSCA